uniref:FBA_2 domain-containing protein n=1 Tax=Steinernema glaseri TaxID=37863 RepID=A0A1I7Z1M8_9BILA
MDAAPWIFVDSVVELFSRKTLDRLARHVRHPLWEPVVDLHHRNRVYDKVFLRTTENDVRRLLLCRGDEGPKRPFNLQAFQQNRRFARIVEINDFTRRAYVPPTPEEVESLTENETAKLLETAASLVDQASGYLCAGTFDGTHLLLTSLFKRVYLRDISLYYCGRIAYDFLEDQINNSSFLKYVDILGYDWPQSLNGLIKKFCLKGKPGNDVVASVESSDMNIDSNDIRNLFDLWRTNGNLHFELICFRGIENKEAWQALMSKGQLKERCSTWRESFFKHDTEKSVAVLVDDSESVECVFYECECDRFERCLLKVQYPEYHNF